MTHRTPPHRAKVYYDDECRICQGLLKRWGEIFRQRGFVFRPLTEGKERTALPFPPEEFDVEMKLETADGTWHGGADAMLYMFRAVWWLAPLGFLGNLPGLRAIARLLYRQIAANRHCQGKGGAG